MNAFSPRRFARLVACDFYENKWYYLREVGSAFVGFSIINILTFFTFYAWGNDSNDVVLQLKDQASILYLVGVGISLLVYASRLFKNLETKQQRVRFLMLPATNLEKYLQRLLRSLIYAPIMLFVGMIAADALRLFIDLFMSVHCGSVIPNVFDHINAFFTELSTLAGRMSHEGVPGAWLVALFASINLLTYSAFLAGSAFFRKYAFLKTSVSIFFVNLLVGLTLNFTSHCIELTLVHANDQELTAVIFFTALFGSMAILFLWLSYFLFKRITVIPKKWF